MVDWRLSSPRMPHTLGEIFTHAQLPDFKNRNSWLDARRSSRAQRASEPSPISSSAASAAASCGWNYWRRLESWSPSSSLPRGWSARMATRWSSHRPARSIRYQSLHVSSSANNSFKEFTGARSRRPHHSHFSHAVDRTAGRRFVVVAQFGKRWEFGDNREVWKAFVCQYAPSHSCCSWGPCGSQTLHARTQTSPLDGQCDCDVIDAEFALRRCHLSLTERIFFSFALFAKKVAIDLKCIENHGGKPWLTPQLAQLSGAPSEIVEESFALLRERTLGAWRWIFKLWDQLSSVQQNQHTTKRLRRWSFGTISDSVRLRASLVYCRAFGRTAKSASTAVAELENCAWYQHVRRNGWKPIRFTSAVLLGLVFLSHWGTHKGFVKYFLRLRSNGKEKREIFCNFRQPPSTLHIHSSDRERMWPEAHCHVRDFRAFSTMGTITLNLLKSSMHSSMNCSGKKVRKWT